MYVATVGSHKYQRTPVLHFRPVPRHRLFRAADQLRVANQCRVMNQLCVTGQLCLIDQPLLTDQRRVTG